MNTIYEKCVEEENVIHQTSPSEDAPLLFVLFFHSKVFVSNLNIKLHFFFFFAWGKTICLYANYFFSRIEIHCLFELRNCTKRVHCTMSTSTSTITNNASFECDRKQLAEVYLGFSFFDFKMILMILHLICIW